MAYNDPTAATLKQDYPAFAAVSDDVVNSYITKGKRWVDTSWTEGDYANAIMLAACHLMVMSGIGAGAEAVANALGLTGYALIRSGSLTLQRGSASGSGQVPEQWAGSAYGKQYYNLLRVNRPRGTVANGGSIDPLDGMGYPLGNPASLYPFR